MELARQGMVVTIGELTVWRISQHDRVASLSSYGLV